MEKEESKPISLSWHNPTLGGECPHCGEWVDWQEQNENEGGDGWHFPPCESKSKDETGFGKTWSVKFTCPDCKKEVEVEEISW